MKTTAHLRRFVSLGAIVAAGMSFGVAARAAGPEVVAGPSADPNCYVPWTDKTKFFKYPAKKGPYRVALANGYIANTWRIQMIQTAKAYAAQPDVAAKLKEFKVVSTGEDVAAQIAAINNFIRLRLRRDHHRRAKPGRVQVGDQARQRRRRRARRVRQHPRHGGCDQRRTSTRRASASTGRSGSTSHLPNGGKILEVRGVSGTSVDKRPSRRHPRDSRQDR